MFAIFTPGSTSKHPKGETPGNDSLEMLREAFPLSAVNANVTGVSNNWGKVLTFNKVSLVNPRYLMSASLTLRIPVPLL